MDNEIVGSYVTKRDGGLSYSYEASWETVGQEIHWKLKVHRGDDFAGETAGFYMNCRGLEDRMGYLMQTFAEDTIEHRVGVD